MRLPRLVPILLLPLALSGPAPHADTDPRHFLGVAGEARMSIVDLETGDTRIRMADIFESVPLQPSAGIAPDPSDNEDTKDPYSREEEGSETVEDDEPVANR